MFTEDKDATEGNGDMADDWEDSVMLAMVELRIFAVPVCVSEEKN